LIIYWAKRLIIAATVIVMILIIASSLFVVVIHQSHPLQLSSTQVDSNTARFAKSAIARNVRLLGQQHQNVDFKVSAAELMSMVEILERTNPDISIHFNMTNNGLYIESTFKSRWQRYINLSLLILPSSSGISIAHLRMGNISLPADYSLKFVDYLLKHFTGIELLSYVNSVATTNHLLTIGYTMVNNKAQLIGSLTNLAKRFGSQHNVDNDLKLTALYYRQLQKIQHHSSRCKSRPLSFFIQSLAQSSAQMSHLGYSAVEQNRAAIFALAVYFGSYRFEYFIGKLATDIPRKPRCYAIPPLAKRVDLTQHFIYSAAIELLSSKQTSEFVGELKELLDSNLNGSGFSFVDLMADRAGVRFAQLATDSEDSAFYHQQLLQRTFSDSDMFPSNITLPEHLTQQAFEHAYQHIDAPAYEAIIQQIDTQLTSLTVYRIP